MEKLNISGSMEANCVIYSMDGVEGSISIWHGDAAEIDYENPKGFGNGTLRDVVGAMKLVKLAIAHYNELSGNARFTYDPDDRDGNGKRRMEFFKKTFPAIECGNLYK
jgi:hypothetical protein